MVFRLSLPSAGASGKIGCMKTSIKLILWGGLWLSALLVTNGNLNAEDVCCNMASPYLGRWALTLPNGAAGWLGVQQDADGALSAAILWGGGSVVPVAETKVDGTALKVVRKHRRKHEGRDVIFVETITATRLGDELSLTTVTQNHEGKEVGKGDFVGQKIPDLPPRPDLSKVKFGSPVKLLNGKDLSGWRSLNPNAPNFWRVEDGILMNRIEAGKHGANIRTEAEFEDFNLKTEVRVPKNGNSGIYLRGIYEVQVAETFERPVNPHNMGALYSRITPSEAAEKPANEWQTLDITLVQRHLTVILNGKKIIDNHPVLGCTGGALTSNEFKPGPIYLQGDHTNVDYRNMVLTPIVD